MKKQLTDDQWETWQNMKLPVDFPRTIDEIREILTVILEQYRGHLNDQLTRGLIRTRVNNLLIELVQVRVLSDHLVVCDDSNNTPEMIDDHKLQVDIYIQPTRKPSFVYIPCVIS